MCFTSPDVTVAQLTTVMSDLLTPRSDAANSDAVFVFRDKYKNVVTAKTFLVPTASVTWPSVTSECVWRCCFIHSVTMYLGN